MTKNNPQSKPARSTIDDAEIGQFDSLGAQWWDENGPMKPLHKLNPVRLAYIREQIAPDATGLQPLQKRTIADIGCGGGLVTEPLCRMGARVTGVDAGQNNIRTAAAHATKAGLDIEYLATSAEALAASGRTFDAVTALEIIEHVADPALFVESCAALVRRGGRLILSTLNRTPKSFALGIVAAEYLLGWVPPGTHDWRKFMKPSELAALLERNGMEVANATGLVYQPLSRTFGLNPRDMDVNYLMTAVKRR